MVFYAASADDQPLADHVRARQATASWRARRPWAAAGSASPTAPVPPSTWRACWPTSRRASAPCPPPTQPPSRPHHEHQPTTSEASATGTPAWTSTPATSWSSGSSRTSRRTRRPEVLGGLGGFAGLCALPKGYREPVLVSCTDGVGTKLKLAFLTGRHDTVGHRPGGDERERHGGVGGRAAAVPRLLRLGQAGGRRGRAGHRRHRRPAACRPAAPCWAARPPSCPASTSPGEYDLAGFCVGVVERRRRASTAAPSPRATCCWGSPRRAFTRTATRWCARCCWSTPGWTWRPGAPTAAGRTAGRRAAAADPHLRALAAQAVRRRPAEGGGPHHRRRAGRQPDAHAARGLAPEAADRRSALDLAAAVPADRPAGRHSGDGDAAHVQRGHRHGGVRGRRSRRTRPGACWRPRARPSTASAGWPPAAGPSAGGVSGMNIGVLVSGSGTNLQALLDAADRRRAGTGAHRGGGRQRARLRRPGAGPAGRGAHLRRRSQERSPRARAFERALVDELRARDVELVVLAGFMRLLTAGVPGRVPPAGDQHPPGAAAVVPGHARAAAGVRARA